MHPGQGGTRHQGCQNDDGNSNAGLRHGTPPGAKPHRVTLDDAQKNRRFPAFAIRRKVSRRKPAAIGSQFGAVPGRGAEQCQVVGERRYRRRAGRIGSRFTHRGCGQADQRRANHPIHAGQTLQGKDLRRFVTDLPPRSVCTDCSFCVQERCQMPRVSRKNPARKLRLSLYRTGEFVSYSRTGRSRAAR